MKKFMLVEIGFDSSVETSDSLVVAAREHCKGYDDRERYLPIDTVDQAIKYWEDFGFRVIPYDDGEVNKKDDYKYSENNLYSLACRLRGKLRKTFERTHSPVDEANYKIGSFAEELYTATSDDLAVQVMIRAWVLTILLRETSGCSPEVKEWVTTKVRNFIDSYEILFEEQKED